MMNAGGRRVGVAIPQNQGLEPGTPMTVMNVTELKLILVEYVDENGRKKSPSLGVVVGGKSYIWPQGEQVAAGFRSFVEAISKQVIGQLEAKKPGSTGAQVVMEGDVEITPEG